MKRKTDRYIAVNTSAAIIAAVVMGGVIHKIMWNDFRTGQTRLPFPSESSSEISTPKVKPTKKPVGSITA